MDVMDAFAAAPFDVVFAAAPFAVVFAAAPGAPAALVAATGGFDAFAAELAAAVAAAAGAAAAGAAAAAGGRTGGGFPNVRGVRAAAMRSFLFSTD